MALWSHAAEDARIESNQERLCRPPNGGAVASSQLLGFRRGRSALVSSIMHVSCHLAANGSYIFHPCCGTLIFHGHFFTHEQRESGGSSGAISVLQMWLWQPQGLFDNGGEHSELLALTSLCSNVDSRRLRYRCQLKLIQPLTTLVFTPEALTIAALPAPLNYESNDHLPCCYILLLQMPRSMAFRRREC